MAKFTPVDPSSAISVQGGGKGLSKLAVTTSGQVFNLQAWAGRYVKITVVLSGATTPSGLAAGFHYGFLPGTGPNSATAPAASALDLTIDSKTIASSEETSGTPDSTDGVSVHEVVPSDRFFLVVKPLATANVRVRQS